MIIKTFQLRKNLKELLKSSYNEDLILDYYGELFKIEPVKAKKLTPAQKAINHFKNLKPRKLTNPIFNEADAAQEKVNFRNLRYGNYDK